LRIIGGRLKGRKLEKIRGTGIRPTADRLREAIFNILGRRVQGKMILDLFAGTGALGIEALSRGAERAVFVDNHPGSTALIRKNLKICRMEDRSSVIKWNVGRNLNCLKPKRKTFDLAFMDPPYDGCLIPSTLVNLHHSCSLADGAWILVEHAMSEPLPKQLPDMVVYDQRRYGKTLVSILKHMV